MPVSPASLLASATADAQAQRWAHIVDTGRLGAVTGSITQDSGPSEGEQTTFGGWGKPASISAPSGALPIMSIGQSSGSTAVQ